MILSRTPRKRTTIQSVKKCDRSLDVVIYKNQTRALKNHYRVEATGKILIFEIAGRLREVIAY